MATRAPGPARPHRTQDQASPFVCADQTEDTSSPAQVAGMFQTQALNPTSSPQTFPLTRVPQASVPQMHAMVTCHWRCSLLLSRALTTTLLGPRVRIMSSRVGPPRHFPIKFHFSKNPAESVSPDPFLTPPALNSLNICSLNSLNICSVELPQYLLGFLFQPHPCPRRCLAPQPDSSKNPHFPFLIFHPPPTMLPGCESPLACAASRIAPSLPQLQTLMVGVVPTPISMIPDKVCLTTFHK